jgi:DNA polymerase-3 subunit gamma/tau
LDQAIAHGAGETSVDQVRAMLGLADRGRVLDLFDLIMKGDAAGALNELSSQYAEGADPMAVLRDMAEITHWVSVIKLSPDAADDPTVSPDERERGKQAAVDLPMRALTRMWQMLLKALEEVAAAPNAMMAAEMAIIRLTHVAELPSPEELVRKLQDMPPTPPTGGGGGVPTNGGGATSAQASVPVSGTISSGPTAMIAGGGQMSQPQANVEVALARYAEFSHVIDLIKSRRDMKLLVEVETFLRLAKYSPGRIEFQLTDDAPRDLATRLSNRLQTWTGARWGVTVVSDGGKATLAEERAQHRDDLQGQALKHDMVQAVLLAFPGAEIRDVKTDEELTAATDAAVQYLEEEDDEWDPFEDE